MWIKSHPVCRFSDGLRLNLLKDIIDDEEIEEINWVLIALTVFQKADLG